MHIYSHLRSKITFLNVELELAKMMEKDENELYII